MFLVALFLTSVLIPYISPYNQDITGAVHLLMLTITFFSHWFGTDSCKGCVYHTIRGILFFKNSLWCGSFSVLLGVPIGMLGCLSGKKTEEIIMRITDGFLAFLNFIDSSSISGH